MSKRLLGITLALVMLFIPVKTQAVLKKPYATEPTSELWNTYDPALHYYYQQLTEQEKRLFSARYDALAFGDKALWDYQVGSLDALSRARVEYALWYDCPELMFYTSYEYLSLMQSPNDQYFLQNAERLKQLNEECSFIVERIMNDDMTDLEKELAFDRYVRISCQYLTPDEDVLYEDLCTAHASLVKGQALCVGYANAAMYTLRCAGVGCIAVTGDIKNFSGREMGHEWVLVNVDGDWYHYDPTWNDLDDSYFIVDFYPYLNLSTFEIRSSHADDSERVLLSFKLPMCASTKANYYEVNRKILDENWETELYLLLKIAIASGENALGVRFGSSEAYSEFVQKFETNNLDVLEKLTLDAHAMKDDNLRFAYFWW